MHGSFRKDDFTRRGSSNPTEETGGPPRHDGFGNVNRRHSEQPSSTPFGGGFPPHNTSRRTFDDERRNEGPKLSHQEKEATDEIRKILEKKQDEDGGCYTDDDVFSDEEDVLTTMVKKQRKEETVGQEKDENGREEEKCHDVLSDNENSGVLEASLVKKQENASASRQVFKSGGFDSPGCQGSLWNWRRETAGIGRYGSSVRWAQMEFDPSGNVTFESPGGYGYSTSYSALLDTTLLPAFNPPSIPRDNSAFGAPRGFGYSSSYSTLDTTRLTYSGFGTRRDGRSSNRAHPSTSSSGFGSFWVAARRDFRADSSARTTLPWIFPGSPGFGNGQGTPLFVTAASYQKPATPSSVAAPTPRESLPAVSTNNSVTSGRPTEEQWRAAWASFRTEEPVFTSWSAATSSATSTGPSGVISSSEPVPSLSTAARPAARTPYIVKPVVVVNAKTSIAALPLSEMPKAEKPAATVRPFVFTKATIRDAHDKNYTKKRGSTFGPYSRQEFRAPRREPFTPGATTSTSVQGQAFQFNTSAPRHTWRTSGPRGGSHGFHSPSSAASPLKPAPTASAAVKPIASVPPSSSFGSPGGSKGLGGPAVAPPSTPTPAASTAAPQNIASAHPGGSGSGSRGGSHGFSRTSSSFTQSKPPPTASTAGVKNVASASSSSSFGSPGGSKGLGGPAVAPPSTSTPASSTAAPKNVASVPSGISGSPGGSNGFYCSTSSSTQSKPTPTSTADVKNAAALSSIPPQPQPRWPKPSQMTRAASPTRTNSSVAPPPVPKLLPDVTVDSIASSSSGLVHARTSNSAGSSDRPPLTPAAFREAVGVDQSDFSNVTTVISSNSTLLPSNSDQPAVTVAPPVEPVVAESPPPSVAPVVRPLVIPAANPEVVVANQLDFGNLDLNEVIYDLMRNERIRDVIKHRNRALYDMMVDYITTVAIHSLNI